MRNRSLGIGLIVCGLARLGQAQAQDSVARPHAGDQQQEQSTAPAANSESGAQNGFKKAETPEKGSFVVDAGTRILLNMINSVSTKHATVGDRVYLETAFPVLSGGKVVIPQGSWVQGTITQVKRPGRVKGRGELYVRFDTLTLPNGVTRDFRARIGAMDGRSTEEVSRDEGKIKAEGTKGEDATKIAQTAGTGAGIGTLAGIGTGHYGMGAGIGGAAGAAAGLAGVLLSRGQDATLTKGTTMEMVLDRPLSFTDTELDFSHAVPRAPLTDGGPQTQQQSNRRSWSPWPF